jgi:nitric oxide reductase large subunit
LARRLNKGRHGLRRSRSRKEPQKEITMKTTNRLETIAKRQRNGRNRDLLFACFVALAAIIGATTVGAAVNAASSDVAQR